MLQMSREQREHLLKYLMARPYAEVAQIVAMLASLKPVEEDNNLSLYTKFVCTPYTEKTI